MADYQSVFPESEEKLTSDEIQKLRAIIQGYPTHNHDGRNTLEVATNTVRNSRTSQQILSPSDITAGQDISNGDALRITSTTAFNIEGIEGSRSATSLAIAQGGKDGFSFSLSDFEQGMTASGQGIVGINVYLRNNSINSITLRCSIFNDSSGSPGATEHAFEQRTFSGSSLNAETAVTFTFLGFIPTAGTTYWVVINSISTDSDTGIYRVSGSNNYTKKTYQLPGATWAADSDSNDWWFQLLFIENSSNRVVRCNAKSSASDNLYVGVSNMNAQANQTVEYISLGTKDDFTGLTTAALYYVSDTGGTLSTTAGRNTIIVGKALSSTMMFLQPPPLS